jgi:hypothetical protein
LSLVIVDSPPPEDPLPGLSVDLDSDVGLIELLAPLRARTEHGMNGVGVDP